MPTAITERNKTVIPAYTGKVTMEISGLLIKRTPTETLAMPYIKLHPQPFISLRFDKEKAMSQSPATKNEILNSVVSVRYEDKGVANTHIAAAIKINPTSKKSHQCLTAFAADAINEFTILICFD